MFKKTFIILFFCGLFSINVFCGVQNVFAQGEGKDPLEDIAGKSGYSTADVTEYSLSQTVGSIIKSVLGILGVLFFVLTFYAGYLWMTASGNEDNIEKAKSIITAATIGLAIIVMAYSITTLVLTSTQKAVTTPTNIGN